MPKLDISIDFSGFDDIESDMQRLEARTIDYGFPYDTPHQGSDTNIPSIAFWNNYGTKTKSGEWKIPPRPFLSDTATVSMFEMDKYTRVLMWEVGKGRSNVVRGLDYVGKELVDLTRTQIGEGDYKALAPSTVEQKGSDTILIDSGQMIDNVTYVIKT